MHTVLLAANGWSALEPQVGSVQSNVHSHVAALRTAHAITTRAVRVAAPPMALHSCVGLAEEDMHGAASTLEHAHSPPLQFDPVGKHPQGQEGPSTDAMLLSSRKARWRVEVVENIAHLARLVVSALGEHGMVGMQRRTVVVACGNPSSIPIIRVFRFSTWVEYQISNCSHL